MIEKYAVDTMHTVFQSHQTPVIIQLPDGRKFLDPNDCITAVYDTVDRFIEINVQNENNKHFQDSSRYMGSFYMNGFKGQRRRRRGPGIGKKPK